MLGFDPLLVVLCEGLLETVHPFNLVAQQGMIDLLLSEGAQPKVCGVLKSLILPLRNSLAQKPKENIKASVKVLKTLIDVVGKDMLPYLKNLLPPLGKHIANK